MLILKSLVTNSHGQEFEQVVTINASSKEELDTILEDVENRGLDREEYKVDDSRAPKDFYDAGGFCEELLSVVNENGKDMSDWTNDWYHYYGK